MNLYIISIIYLFVVFSTEAFVSTCASYDIENTHPSKVRVGIVNKCMVKGDTLYLDGAIDPYIIDELRVYPVVPIRKVSLNSGGGLVKDAFEIAEFIRNNNIITEVRKDAVCKSACTLLFQAGVQRNAHKTAVFMFHGARYLNHSKEKKQMAKDCVSNPNAECSAFIEENYLSLKETTDQLFNLYLEYDIRRDFYQSYLSLPEDPNWYEDGNFLKIQDWEMTAVETTKYNIVQKILN